MKQLIASIATAVVILTLPAVAFAHVIVTPNTAGIGEELVFNVSVPNERQTPVTSVRLIIPSGVTDVLPTIQPGWAITTTSNNNPKDPEITSITWTGSMPVGQRDDFSFGAQVPATATQLDWRAYQTYGDGTVVHWDQKPDGDDDAVGTAGPYSVTHVVNDLTSSSATIGGSSSKDNLTLILSIAALILSIGSLFLHPRSKQ